MKVRTLVIIIFISLLTFTLLISSYFALTDAFNSSLRKLSNQKSLVDGIANENLKELSKGLDLKIKNRLPSLLYVEKIEKLYLHSHITDTVSEILPVFKIKNIPHETKCLSFINLNLFNFLFEECVSTRVTKLYGKDPGLPMVELYWQSPLFSDPNSKFIILKNTVFFMIFGIFLSYLIYYFLDQKIVKPLSLISRILKDSPQETINIEKFKSTPPELTHFVDSINSSYENISTLNNMLIDKAKLEAKVNVSTQVAHDIRSPLAALDMILTDLPKISEEKRSIIRNATGRIHDIAENLLSANNTLDTSPKDKSKQHLLTSLLEPLIAEKRTQYRKVHGLEITSNIGIDSFGIFVNVNDIEFKRVFSNLINNSAEALDGPGKIKVSISTSNNKVEIAVTDDGPGIPTDNTDLLLNKGVSHGKTGGNGLGLFHARESVISWKGNIFIKNNKDKGAEVKITLPVTPPPNWFLKTILLEKNQQVVIFDDDETIHQIWESRLNQVQIKKHNISTKNFTSPKELRTWFNSRNKHLKYLYLFDFEILGSDCTGLELIKEFNIMNDAVLVSSHNEEHMLKKCEEEGILLLPKNLAIYVPIKISSKSTITTILIDDDFLIRTIWESEAKKNNVPLTTFPNVKDFLENIQDFDKNTTIYIDSDLGENKSGEEFAKDLSAQGFSNLYIASGYDADKFKDYSFLKGVVGKTPPWQKS